jgi:hypothetical protein
MIPIMLYDIAARIEPSPRMLIEAIRNVFAIKWEVFRGGRAEPDQAAGSV